MKKFLAFYLLLSVSLVSHIHAQVPDIRFERVALPTNSAFCIAQDSQGFMWIGTKNGLLRYDGYTFTVFHHDPTDSTSLSYDYVESLFVDRDGALWVGTWHGLNRFDHDTESFVHYWHNPSDSNSLTSNQIDVIHQDRNCTLWVGTPNGLNRFDPTTNSFQQFLPDSTDFTSLSHHEVRVIYEDKRGVLWIGTGNPFYGTPSDKGGLNRYDASTGTFVRYMHNPLDESSLIDSRITTIFEDSHSTLWIGTWGDGLHTMDRDTGTFTRYRYDPDHPYNLSNPHKEGFSVGLRFIHEDRTGILWVGGYGGGIYRYDPVSGTLKQHTFEPDQPNSLSWDYNWSIYESHDGTIWIANQMGIDKVVTNTGSFNFFQIDQANPAGLSGSVSSMAEDREGYVWIGTYTSGLNRMESETGRFDHIRHEPENPMALSDDRISALFEDREGVLWIGTNGSGLSRMDRDTETFTTFLHDPDDSTSISHNIIAPSSIFEDQYGELWVGTVGGGLNRMNRTTGLFKRYVPPPENDFRERVRLLDRLDEEGHLLQSIVGVGNNEDRTARFKIEKETSVLIVTTNQAFNPSSYANDFGWIEDGSSNVIWEASLEQSKPIGWPGFRIQTDTSTFATGQYRLRFRSDHSISYSDNWGGYPVNYPDRWGIQIYELPEGSYPVLDEDRQDYNTGAISGLYIGALYEDREGILWVGTETGLDRYDRETDKFVHYTFPHNGVFQISALCEDLLGRLWVSVHGDGLYCFDKETGTTTQVDIGIDFRHRDMIRGIIEDEEGFLWIASQLYLTRMDPVTGAFRHFSEFKNVDIPNFMWGSHYKSGNGELFLVV